LSPAHGARQRVTLRSIPPADGLTRQSHLPNGIRDAANDTLWQGKAMAFRPPSFTSRNWRFAKIVLTGRRRIGRIVAGGIGSEHNPVCGWDASWRVDS